MVQWKGSIERSEVGDKAVKLDSVEGLDVPNFFVLTRSEVDSFVDSEDPRRVANVNIPDEVMEEVRDAYGDIGMSSEVRNASGEARNLVGNQRESQRVSVRIASTANRAEYSLNIGASGLEEALRTVLSSYYRHNSNTPSVIFQKMIEPEYTGAVVKDYTRRHTLVELVEGLGHSLEEGTTVPEFYLERNGSVTDRRVPEKQVKISRNPMNGNRRTRKISKDGQSFKDSKIESITRKASREDLSLKFAYKRGTFYIVDAFRTRPLNTEPDLEALKVSQGEIEGREGEDYRIVDEPEETEKPFISRKGGFTSTASQIKRMENTPAVVSLLNREKIQGQEVQEQKEQTMDKKRQEDMGVQSVAATKVRDRKQFPQLSDNPFGRREEPAKTCEELLVDRPEILDASEIDPEALNTCLEHVKPRVIASDRPSEQLIQSIVEHGIPVLAVPGEEVDRARKEVMRWEKRFMMDKLRD
ncbi:MAG: PEP/pyruvate-binding domain-containing protein [Candidatus Nanohalobium sp.]